MSAIVYLCGRDVYWFAEDHTSQCVRPAGHRSGLHSDGLWWFDDDGLRVPQDRLQTAPHCRVHQVDGEPVRLRGDGPLSAEGQAALTEVVRAAKALLTPEMTERQDAAITRHRERLQRLGIRR